MTPQKGDLIYQIGSDSILSVGLFRGRTRYVDCEIFTYIKLLFAGEGYATAFGEMRCCNFKLISKNIWVARTLEWHEKRY